MKKYLLNVTFCAGSCDPEDVDRDLYLLCVENEISENEMKHIFQEVNRLFNPFEYADFPTSYGNGLNINTLMEGVEIYTKGKLIEVHSDCGSIDRVDNCYVIEQWQ